MELIRAYFAIQNLAVRESIAETIRAQQRYRTAAVPERQGVRTPCRP